MIKDFTEVCAIEVRGGCGTGKTTKAKELYDDLKANNVPAVLLDDGVLLETFEGDGEQFPVIVTTLEYGGRLTVGYLKRFVA